MTTHTDLLQHHSRSHDTVVAAVADNCRFDERASSDRWRQFDALLSGLVAGRSVIHWWDWTEANQLHLDQKCNVASTSVPDAFLEINRTAWLTGLSDNQTLVRIEALPRALAGIALALDDLIDLLQRSDDGDRDAGSAVRFFFDTWNQRRDARPAFAAFYDEVKQEADHADWPHVLRDRLGLGHYGYSGSTPLPVALMRYPLADVLSSQTHQQLAVACSVPTVLDGGMHEFFFPVPQEHPYGATVHLVPDQADTLTAEIVHCRIDYEREHLWRLGWITRPHQMPMGQLPDARDLHLLALQVECDRCDFGEPFKGRI